MLGKMFKAIPVKACHQSASISSISICSCLWYSKNCWRQSRGNSNQAFSKFAFSFFDLHHLLSGYFSTPHGLSNFTEVLHFILEKIQFDV